MKKTIELISVITVIFCGSIFFACQNEVVDTPPDMRGEVSFSFSKLDVTYDTNSIVQKSASLEEDAFNLIVSITDLNGSIIYNQEVLRLIKLNGSYITTSLLLEAGNFKLTEFLVADEEGNIIYTTPLEGSAFEHLVSNPLAIDFDVSDEQITKITPEVISTECNCSAIDFGYTTFNFTVLETIYFMINVQTYNNSISNWEFTSAELKVYGDLEFILEDAIDATIDSIIVNDGFTNYTLSIKKEGYYDVDTVLTTDELKTYLNKPLLIILEESPFIVEDIDGNIYKTVQIGDQNWMAENLKVTRYADGTAIPHITDNTAWADLDNNLYDKAYCFYNNDESLGFGALYTYAAATNSNNSGNMVQGVCPTGWHLASDEEWKTLEKYLGMSEYEANDYSYRGTTEGLKLKGTRGWSDNGNGTDEVGFSALQGGYRGSSDFSDGNARFWTSTEGNAAGAWERMLYSDRSDIGRGNYGKSLGNSVRCIED